MSLSAWEKQSLDSIENGLAESDPALTVLLTTFTQMVSGEEMPAVEEIVVVSWSPMRRSLRKRRRRRRGGLRRYLGRTRRRLGFRWVALTLWLVITVTLVCIALSLSSGSRVSCTGSWSTVCAAPTSHPSTQKAAVSHVPASTAVVTP